MATIKSYTDLEQSKKLAEFLLIKSADMVLLHEEPYETSDSKFDGLHQALCVPFNKYDKSWRQKYKNISYFPCWSLAVLLDVIPKPDLVQNSEGTWLIRSWINAYPWSVGGYSNPVDACVAMVEKLHKLNLL